MSTILIVLLIVVLGWQYAVIGYLLFSDEIESRKSFLIGCIPFIWIYAVIIKIKELE